MIKTIEDLFKYINTEDQIILMHKNYKFTSPLIIGNTSKIIGNGCELSGPLLICSDIIIENVTFSNSEDIINIRSDSKIKFTKCTFIGNSTNTAIILEPHSNSSVSLKQCTFSRFVSAISVNENNSLPLLKNCIFQFCTLAIDKIVSNSYINVNEIKNNLMFNSKESIFLKFYESFNTYDYYNFCFELCNNNNFARIFGKNNSIIFDTISFYARNIKELNHLLSNCSYCTTIFLNEGMYYLDYNTEINGILITKPVNLIGINSPTLTKLNEDSTKYAITINSSNVKVSNFKIDGSENFLFRDGIHFEENGGENIVIDNVEITRITRRGISFFGKSTNNCLVKNCRFSYISEPFSSEFTAKITYSKITNIPCSLVTNSLYPNDPLKKTLIIGKIDYLNATDSDKALINLIVPTNETYTITIYKNDTANTSASKDIELVPYSAISDPKTDITVTTTGNKIAKVLFKYPIRNAFSSVPVDASGNPITTGTPAGHILYNFYALYYNRDTNSSIDPRKGEWSGALNLDTPSLTANLSSDGKALILQDTLLSIPLTEDISHILAINKGRYHLDPTDKSKVLTDYSEEQRIIPSMEVGFDVSITSTPAVPISAVAPVRNQITVIFSNAVLTPYFTSTNPISNAKILFLSDGSVVKLSSIERVPDTFNSLIFNIDNSNPLPSGIITIGVGSPKTDSGDLIDACGYIVPFTKLSVNVGSVPPTLESVVQDTDSSNKDNTVIDLTFSTSMLADVSGKGANNPANYTFLDSSCVSQPIQSTEFITASNNSKIKMTFKNLLGAGLYTLKIQANAITDSIGENIAYTTYSVTIEDTTQPSVIEIIGLNSKGSDGVITDSSNALIIKYKTPMNIIGGTANSTCAADKIDNYKFYESTVSATNAPLPIGTVATPLKNNNWIRFILPVGTYPTFDTTAHDGTPNPNYSIYIGYTGLDTINYVCNTSGNIYPLCSLRAITATVPLIDLSKGTAEIISDSELVYTYTDGSIVNGQFYHNEFNKIDTSDFVIGVSDQIITTPTPLSIKDVSLSQDGTKITFTFDPKTFTSAYKYAYIGASESNAIIDIFGKGLTGSAYNKEIINSVPSTLVGISLTDISRTQVAGSIANGYPVTIALKFSNAIKNTSASDFLMAFNNVINIPIDSAAISTVNSNTIILKGTIPYMATDELINSIAIRTSADSSFLSTKDINGNTIKSFNYLFVDNLSVKSAAMAFLTSGDLNGASLTAVFNKELDFTTNPLLSVANSTTGIDFTAQSFTDDASNLGIASINLGTGTTSLGTITLTKVTKAAGGIFTSGALDTSFTINVKKGNSNSELVITFTTTTNVPAPLNISNSAYIEYTGAPYLFMDKTKAIYVNTSSDYNANAALK